MGFSNSTYQQYDGQFVSWNGPCNAFNARKNKVPTCYRNSMLDWFCRSSFNAHGIFFFRLIFSTTHSVEKREILSHQKIFRQINSLVTYLVKPLLSRNFCQKCVRENSRNFHTVRSIQHFHGIFSTKRERTRVKFVIFTVYS